MARQRVLFGWLVVVVVALMRAPWISCDGGFESFWGYGYFITDEGYYTGDGRLAYLTGNFFSPNGESFSFFRMPMANLLAYLSYQIFGLHLWALRLPQLVCSLFTWWMIYYMGSKRTAPWISGLLVGLISLAPPCLAYERTVSTDFMMGSFVVAAYWFLTQKNPRFSGLWAALSFSMACATKISAVALLPLLLATALHHHKQRWVRIGLFGIGTAALLLAGHHWMMDYVAEKAAEHNLPVSEALLLGDRVDKLPPLGVERIPEIIRALSISPRWPVASKVSFFVVWIMGLSGVILLRKSCHTPFSRWQRHETLSLGLLAYCLLISIHNFFNVRYLLPVFCFVPLLMIEARKGVHSVSEKGHRYNLLIVAGLITCALLVFWKGPLSGVDPIHVAYDQYRAPERASWAFTWPSLLLYSTAGTSLIAPLLHRKNRITYALVGLLCFAWIGVLLSTVSPQLRTDFELPAILKNIFGQIQNLFIVQLVFLASGLFLLGNLLRKYRVWYGVVLLFYLSTFYINPIWRKSIPEMLERRTHVQKVADQLQNQLPANSVIIGDRALSMFGESQFTLIPHATKAPKKLWLEIKKRLVHKPRQPIYVMLDPAQNQCWHELDLCKKDFKYTVISKIQLPSFFTGRMTETYLARLQLADCARR